MPANTINIAETKTTHQFFSSKLFNFIAVVPLIKPLYISHIAIDILNNVFINEYCVIKIMPMINAIIPNTKS